MANIPIGKNISLSAFKNSALLDSAIFLDYFERLRGIACVAFEWKGLPDSIDVRFLEQALFDFGKAAFVYDKKMGYLGLRCTPSSSLNVYGVPKQLRAYGIGDDYNETFSMNECVLIRNNYMCLPTFNTISIYAARLYEADVTTFINIKAQKTPIFIKCPESQRLTMKNLYQKYDGNQPFMMGDKDLDVNGFQVLKTDAPFVADKLYNYKKQIWNEAMLFLGIKNADTEKRERMITSEVDSNTEQVKMSAQVMLQSRQEAAEQFNKMFGFKVSVKMREFGGENIEPIHNGNTVSQGE